jgi:hypothetical protein
MSDFGSPSLYCSLQRDLNRVRVNAQLVDAESGIPDPSPEREKGDSNRAALRLTTFTFFFQK